MDIKTNRVEMEGFEPSVEISPNTRLAIGLLRPLGHISLSRFIRLVKEEEGLLTP